MKAQIKIFKSFRILVFGIICLSSCAGGKGCAPRFADLKTQYPHVLYHGIGNPSEVIIKRYPPEHWTSLAGVSKVAQGAILVSEDWAFYQHPGYDSKQIQEAINQSIESRKLKRGASTITQQVVRNIYLSKEKSLVRKVRELWMATKIEKVLGKAKILELYLNIAEFGEGVFGIGQASQYYFQKLPSQLSAKEGAFLAMLLPSPKRYSASFKKKVLSPYARKIIHSVLGKMSQARYLTAEEYQAEWLKPLSFETAFDSSVPSDTDGASEEENETNASEDLQSE